MPLTDSQAQAWVLRCQKARWQRSYVPKPAGEPHVGRPRSVVAGEDLGGRRIITTPRCRWGVESGLREELGPRPVCAAVMHPSDVMAACAGRKWAVARIVHVAAAQNCLDAPARIIALPLPDLEANAATLHCVA